MAESKKKQISLTMEEAIVYLKSIDEWQSAQKFDRETVLAWANFLKNKGVVSNK